MPRGKDSNEAVETFQESYEQGDDDGLDENDDPEEEEIILPPKDGSLKVNLPFKLFSFLFGFFIIYKINV